MQTPRNATLDGAAAMCLLITWATAPSATAEVLSTSARVEITVQEFIDGQPASFTDDGEEFTTAAEPAELSAFGRLTSTDLGGLLEAMGQSFSDFLPPANLSGNPRELAVEAACYSNSNTASYSVRSTAEEERQILLGPTEADFDTNGVAIVQSRFFLSGAIILWSIDPSDLANVEGSAHISVMDEDNGEVLFESEISVRNSGESEPELNVTGPVSARTVSLSELADLGVAGASLAVLQDVQDRGQLLIVVIPTQSHPYDYGVTRNVPLTLQARLQIELSNTTGQTGVAATIGRPFSNLAAFIHTALPEVNGESLQSALNKAIAQTGGADPSPSVPSTPSACGAFGVEAILLPFLVLACVPCCQPPRSRHS